MQKNANKGDEMGKISSENKTVPVLVKLPESVAKIIEEMAEKEKNPKATVVRRLIMKGLEASSND